MADAMESFLYDLLAISVVGTEVCQLLMELLCFAENAVLNRIQHPNLYQLVQAYRAHGHRKALLDPLGLSQPSLPVELEPSMFGLSLDDPTRYSLQGILNTGHESASAQELVQELDNIYCGTLAAEFQHLSSPEEREWFATRFEQIQQESLSSEEQVDIAKLMLQSQAFDIFLASKFSSVKRYGGEGAESAMVFYEQLFKLAAHVDIHDVIICIAHRGRLNLLTCLLQVPPVVMFRKMKGKREFPAEVVGSGDVLSHLTSSVDLQYGGKDVHVTMMPNPSHLEAVNPVGVGKARARQQSLGAGEYAPEGQDGRPGDKVLCFQVHGDAAFSAQGVVPETFAMANVPHYTVGGSVHLIINNQIGFTTEAGRGRSSQYTSDVGKMIDCPVIHVNADHPKDVWRACHLAMEYREKFRRDVVVDYVCFRRWGHNEMDEPSFTQPTMYNVVRNRSSIPDAFAAQVVEEGLCTKEDLDTHRQQWNTELADHYKRLDSYVPEANHLQKQWAGLSQPKSHICTWDTGVPLPLLKFVGAKSVSLPDGVKPHPTLIKSHLEKRLKQLEEGVGLDWGTAEALAMGSLLLQGFNVRISGQDVGRGTFSHRHAMIVDQQTDAATVPLNHLTQQQTGFLEVCNSVLSEEAVLGFEYGVSVENPKILVIWEAQFGDFHNGAQIMIDTFVTGGETKWLLQSGLVMLLPHGMDGAGPEHSSCRMERFLQLCDSKEDAIDGDDINIQIVNPTTPAQYFHLLRRQMVRNFRQPLVVVAPKVMLRHASAVCCLAELAPGTTFQPVLPDPHVDPQAARKLVFVCGKHYYTLQKERENKGITNVAIIRLESLCPFPAEEIRKEISKYPNAKEFIWSQEEHRNQGPWAFVAPRFECIVGRMLDYVGRDVHATPAVGVGEQHQKEAELINHATLAAAH